MCFQISDKNNHIVGSLSLCLESNRNTWPVDEFQVPFWQLCGMHSFPLSPGAQPWEDKYMGNIYCSLASWVYHAG